MEGDKSFPCFNFPLFPIMAGRIKLPSRKTTVVNNSRPSLRGTIRTFLTWKKPWRSLKNRIPLAGCISGAHWHFSLPCKHILQCIILILAQLLNKNNQRQQNLCETWKYNEAISLSLYQPSDIIWENEILGEYSASLRPPHPPRVEFLPHIQSESPLLQLKAIMVFCEIHINAGPCEQRQHNCPAPPGLHSTFRIHIQ